MYLGLDISTTAIGVCVLNNRGEVHYSDVIVFQKNENYYDKLLKFENYITNSVMQKWIFRKVFVEKPLIIMGGNSSNPTSAHILSLLNRFNGSICWICFKNLHVEPDYLDVRSARKKIGVTVPRGYDAKEVCAKYLLDKKVPLVLEYTKTGKVRKTSYDKSDAMVICLAGYIEYVGQPKCLES